MGDPKGASLRGVTAQGGELLDLHGQSRHKNAQYRVCRNPSKGAPKYTERRGEAATWPHTQKKPKVQHQQNKSGEASR